MDPMKKMILGAMLIAVLAPASASAATYKVASDTPPDMQAWMDARGLETDSYLTVGEGAGAKRSNCWHAKLYAGIREHNGDRVVFAWEKSIVCQWDGRFQTKRVARDKGTPGAGWHDGPNLGIKWQHLTRNQVETFYETDFAMGYSRWTLQLDLKQYLSHMVGRKVKWGHGATAGKG